MIEHDRLLKLVRYDPITGIFTARIDLGHRRRAGDQICRVKTDNYGRTAGYRGVTIQGQKYYAHRLAYFYMLGCWPQKFIDHIDGDKGNNSWANLRESTNGENQMNSRVRRDNRLGIKNIAITKSGTFQITVWKNGKAHCATAPTLEDAVDLRNRIAVRLHGEFAHPVSAYA